MVYEKPELAVAMGRSMHVRRLLTTASAGLLLLAAGIPARADEPDEAPPQYQLEVIVTTALRESEEFFCSVEKLSAEELRERNLSTLAEALDDLPGVRAHIARAGHGQYVSLRGFDQQHLLVLVDGVPLCSPYDGLVELDQIPSDQIQTIRVMKGSSSARYGPNALGGTINIITKNDQVKPYRGAVAEIGRNGTSRLRLYSGWQMGDLAIQLSGSRARCDGFPLSKDFRETEVPDLPAGQELLHYEDGGRRDNSDYSKDAAHLILSYLPDDRLRLDFSGSLVDNQWGVPPHPFYNPKKNATRIRYWRFNEWQQRLANLSMVLRISDQMAVKSAVFLNKFDNTLDGYDDESYCAQDSSYAFHTIYDDHAVGARIHLEGPLGSLGSATIGGGLVQDIHQETPDWDAATDKFASRTWWFSADDRVKLTERVSAAFGANYAFQDKRKAPHRNDLGDDLSALNPHLSLACLTSKASRVFLSLAHQSRFPTMKQLYGKDGNPQLKTQKTIHLELGGEWAPVWNIRLRGSLFHDSVRDFIESNYLSPTPDNIQRARFWGGELALEGNPLPGLRAMLAYSYVRATNRSRQRPGDDLQYRPEHQLDWRIRLDMPHGFDISFDGTAVSRQHYYDDFHDRRLSHLSPYAVGNLTLRGNLTFSLEPFVTISNILDASYHHIYTSPAPGREVRGGLRLSW